MVGVWGSISGRPDDLRAGRRGQVEGEKNRIMGPSFHFSSLEFNSDEVPKVERLTEAVD